MHSHAAKFMFKMIALSLCCSFANYVNQCYFMVIVLLVSTNLPFFTFYVPFCWLNLIIDYQLYIIHHQPLREHL